MSSIGEIRLHIKILSNPERFSVDDMINEMKSIYKNAANIVVKELSREFLNLPLLQDIDVGRCVRGETTEEQEELFRNRPDNADTTDVVVYFVRSTIPPLNGCAAHSVGRPGCVVTKYSSRFTVAHEVGHVLNLRHVLDSDRLMYGLGTDNITNAPPNLIVTEIDTIKNSESFKAI